MPVCQSLRDALRDNMLPLWIVLTLLPILGAAERFNCRGRILGAYYADAKSGCKAFHVCVRVAGGGIRDFRFFCPPGTLFHQEAQTCTDWGDDDPLACPADLYDGQFDLYRIGSGFDTKKLSSPGNRDDEAEFGLQRAETGDRRLAQNNVASNGPTSDLRTAHSSDFFSGQRDRGRDDSPSTSSTAPRVPSAPQAPPRQHYRRPTTQRTTPITTPYTTQPSTPPPQPSSPPQYDFSSKRKLVRKRPIYSSTQPPSSTFVQNIQTFSEPQQNYNRKPSQQYRQYQETSPTPANVPPQYKDEYVEVSRVTPKQNRYLSNNISPDPYSQSTHAPNFSKKEGLVELYNYESQSTPEINVKITNDNRPFKVRNSFIVSTDVPRDPDYLRNKNVNVNSINGRTTTTTDSSTTRGFVTSTGTYRNFNSVSNKPEKNNFAQFSNAKQSYYTSPTTIPTTTTIYTTTRSDPPLNLNTVAYNTNIGFNTQSSNYPDNDEDDGQYHPPRGEDDGQYRPDLYDRELLSGAHSLNIAASGNRLPEDQKPYRKTNAQFKSQVGVPRPFRPAQTSTVETQTTRAPEPTTTFRPQTVSTQRTFDYFQTYTTTSRPSESPTPVHATQNYPHIEEAPVRPTTTAAPRTPESRPQTRPPLHPTSRAPHYAHPANNKEDTSYDYAYYDSDPGFSEYDHIEEFGKTKTKF